MEMVIVPGAVYWATGFAIYLKVWLNYIISILIESSEFNPFPIIDDDDDYCPVRPTVIA